MKAIFRYPGSKWSIADWIISHFPEGYEKMVYLEPFCGSGAVFFNKNPGAVETVNDMESDIVNLFRVLREHPDELKRVLELTPYSREEYDRSFEPCDDPVEKARRFMVKTTQAIGAKMDGKCGWRNHKQMKIGGTACKWGGITETIDTAAARLRGDTTHLVQIEHSDALQLIRRYNFPEVLMYLDPPYVRSTRKSGKLYRYEMDDAGETDYILGGYLSMKGIKILLVMLLIVAVMVSIPWRPASVEEIPAPVTATPEPSHATAAPTPEPPPRPVVVTEYKGEGSEAWLWDTLSRYTPSEEVTAGIMAYFYRESLWRSDAVAGWTVSQAYSGVDHCAVFTTEIDAGLEDGSTREEFILRCREQYGGYGLGQWGSPNYTAALYDYAQAWGTSIADAEMQCAFTVYSMQAMPELWAGLLEADTPARAGWLIGILYDGTPAGAESISKMAKVFYERWTE